MNRKKKSETTARVICALIGLFILFQSANKSCLNILGDVAIAYDVNVVCRGSKDDTIEEKKWRFDISYSYSVDGVEYDGVDAGVRGPRLGPKYDLTVHYYPFAPQISTLFAEEATGAGIIITVAFGILFLLIAVVPRKKAASRLIIKTKIDDSGLENYVDLDGVEPVTMAWLMENTSDYDDRLEEYYQNGWDKNDSSWQCRCGKWNTNNFCKQCGYAREV